MSELKDILKEFFGKEDSEGKPEKKTDPAADDTEEEKSRQTEPEDVTDEEELDLTKDSVQINPNLEEAFKTALSNWRKN